MATLDDLKRSPLTASSVRGLRRRHFAGGLLLVHASNRQRGLCAGRADEGGGYALVEWLLDAAEVSLELGEQQKRSAAGDETLGGIGIIGVGSGGSNGRWMMPREQMTSGEDIERRMAEEFALRISASRPVVRNDLLELGWREDQVAAHGLSAALLALEELARKGAAS